MSCDPVGGKHCIGPAAECSGMGWWTLKIAAIRPRSPAPALDRARYIIGVLVTAYYLNRSHESPINQWIQRICYTFNASTCPLAQVVEWFFIRGGEGVGERESRKPHDWIQLPEKLPQ